MSQASEEEYTSEMFRRDVGRAIAEDLPRIVRSDITRATEMVAKYAAAPDAPEVMFAALQLREALAAYAMRLNEQRAPTPMGPGVEAQDPMPPQGPAAGIPEPAKPSEPWDAPPPVRSAPARQATQDDGVIEVDGLGRAMLLVDVLKNAGLASSSGLARQGVRAGQVRVDGTVISHPGAMLEPGRYLIDAAGAERVVRVL